jgi:quercetin dioxygenase-like cupin family protein
MSNEKFAAWLDKLKAMKNWDPDRNLPESLVTHSSDAQWLEADVTGNPSRIGVLLDLPARSFDLYLQEIPAGEASDLQRHPHESIHYVTEGAGYSEIGVSTVEWGAGDFIYTPPWAWHRHYSTSDVTTKILLIENTPVVDHVGLAQRESAGLLSFAEFQKHNAPSSAPRED